MYIIEDYNDPQLGIILINITHCVFLFMSVLFFAASYFGYFSWKSRSVAALFVLTIYVLFSVISIFLFIPEPIFDESRIDSLPIYIIVFAPHVYIMPIGMYALLIGIISSNIKSIGLSCSLLLIACAGSFWTNGLLQAYRV
jgi:hypothetical protein